MLRAVRGVGHPKIETEPNWRRMKPMLVHNRVREFVSMCSEVPEHNTKKTWYQYGNRKDLNINLKVNGCVVVCLSGGSACGFQVIRTVA